MKMKEECQKMDVIYTHIHIVFIYIIYNRLLVIRVFTSHRIFHILCGIGPRRRFRCKSSHIQIIWNELIILHVNIPHNSTVNMIHKCKRYWNIGIKIKKYAWKVHQMRAIRTLETNKYPFSDFRYSIFYKYWSANSLYLTRSGFCFLSIMEHPL